MNQSSERLAHLEELKDQLSKENEKAPGGERETGAKSQKV
jgi:hypothetical protein